MLVGAAGGEPTGGTLLRSLYRGACSFEPPAPSPRPVAYLFIGLNLLGGETDRDRVKKWARLFRTGGSIHVLSDIKEKNLESRLKRCHGRPTFLYMNGHAKWMPEGGYTYFPNGSVPADSEPKGVKGIPFSIIGEWMIGTKLPVKLMVVTDVCNCTNFLKLPYMAQSNGEGVWTWQKTIDGRTGESDDYWEGKTILHFASTDESSAAYEWASVGGIYTREFCNVPLQAPLRERLNTMQDTVTSFVSKHANGGVQRSRLYSSCKINFDDKDVLKDIIFPNH